MIILLLFFLSSLHLPCCSCSPDCVVDHKQCLVTGDNFLSNTMAVQTSEECGQLCQENPACTAFTHFGSESHFLSDACMLFSSCTRRGECEDCVTGSTQGECVCSIPYQGVKDAGNLEKLFFNITDELQCKGLCSKNAECKAYTYYNEQESTNPLSCALLSSGELSGPSVWPCDHCATGPAGCQVGQECQVRTFDHSLPLLVEESITLSFIAGEKDCYTTVWAVAVGRGGNGRWYDHSWGRGGGSGYVTAGLLRLTSKDIKVTIELGTSMGTIIEIDGNAVLEAPNGKDADSRSGGNGYSGGGGINAAGGTSGGNGTRGFEGYERKHPEGGIGSGLNITELTMKNFVLSAGPGGKAKYLYPSEAGGGGGLLVNGAGPEVAAELRENDGQGYGAGGGSGNFHGKGEGLSGCVILEFN